LARYTALLTKALHLLDHAFTTRLEKILSELARQIAATQSDSARHALAYGRFEEMIMETYSLLPNIRKIIRVVYDQYGRRSDANRDISTYVEAASNIFRTYLSTRDRELKVMTQHDLEEFKKETKSLSVETAARNYVKHGFERMYDEENLFIKIFNMEPSWSSAPSSAFQVLATINTSMIHPAHMAPLGTAIQSALQGADLKVICSVTGWLASEYSIAEADEEESPFFLKCREYAARILAHHLWPFTDKAFDAEITKSISKASAPDGALKIGPVEGGVSSSNAYTLVKRAIELLVLFDQSMPKERSVSTRPYPSSDIA
jgi:conserved oligomeric Golgi complex subunit 3